MFQHDKTNVALFIYFLLKRIPSLKSTKCSLCNKLFTLLVHFSHHNLKPLPQVPICLICFQHCDKTMLSFFFSSLVQQPTTVCLHISPYSDYPTPVCHIHQQQSVTSDVVFPLVTFHGIFHPVSFWAFWKYPFGLYDWPIAIFST